MAKYLPDGIIDLMLAEIRKQVTGISVCSTQPTTYAHATSTYKLADANGLTSSAFTLDNGDSSGRKITMKANNTLAVDTTGTAAHVAWWSTTGSGLLVLVTTCTTQALTTGNTVNIPAHDFEIRDVA
jgi:hypothetical protein